ncbi:hypothetical protein AB0O47_40380, partial [Streptomyces noursei]|uniref:hypothetical protein n=1 Tax=Streptomyces noursei TaxID=1971 RepID=UPI00344EF7F3
PNWQTYWQPIDVGAQAQPPGYGLFTWTGYMALDVTGTERQEIHFDTTHFANGLDRTGGHIYPTTPDRVWDISLRFWGTTTAAVRVFAGSSSFGPSQSRALGLLILPAPRDQQSGDSFILLGAGAGKTTDKNPIGPITIGADSEDTAAIVAIDHVEMTVRELGTS